ncbi:MAG TPA: hypothetical protein VFG00_14450 [Acidothermaceae bacterium]|nr:hypothetical protein [Acidothermaceae bacterium]
MTDDTPEVIVLPPLSPEYYEAELRLAQLEYDYYLVWYRNTVDVTIPIAQIGVDTRKA